MPQDYENAWLNLLLRWRARRARRETWRFMKLSNFTVARQRYSSKSLHRLRSRPANRKHPAPASPAELSARPTPQKTPAAPPSCGIPRPSLLGHYEVAAAVLLPALLVALHAER